MPSLPPGWIRLGPGVAAAPGSRQVHNADLDVLGWRPPPLLVDLYGRHHGIGPWHGAWLPWAVLPWADVVPLTARVRFGEEDLLFDPADAVLICRDPLGGGLVLQGRDAPVFRWFAGGDHRLGPPITPRTALLSVLARWVEG